MVYKTNQHETRIAAYDFGKNYKKKSKLDNLVSWSLVI